ncbi:MAG: restriction endonuclease subunit S [bacterium]
MSKNVNKDEELPKGWRKVKLGEACYFKRGPFGSSLKKDSFVKNGYAVYEQKHAIYNQFVNVRYFINEAKFKEMKGFEVRPGDLIMSCSGTMGKVAIIPKSVRAGIINQALLKLTPDNMLSGIFLKLWMDSSEFHRSLSSVTFGNAIKNVASVKVLKELPLPLPPLPQQKAIASLLETWDTAIEKTEALIAAKEKRFKWLLKTLISDQQSNPEWRKVKLGDVLSYEQPAKYIVTSTKYSDHDGVAVLTANKSFILGYTQEKEGIFNDPPVIIFDDFTTATKYVDFPFKIKSSAMKILKIAKRKMDLQFVFYSMQFIDFPLGGHQRYWISEYQHLEIKIPNIEEQRNIIDTLNVAQKEIDILKYIIKQHRIQKRGLMQKLLTGKWAFLTPDPDEKEI